MIVLLQGDPPHPHGRANARLSLWALTDGSFSRQPEDVSRFSDQAKTHRPSGPLQQSDVHWWMLPLKSYSDLPDAQQKRGERFFMTSISSRRRPCYNCRSASIVAWVRAIGKQRESRLAAWSRS